MAWQTAFGSGTGEANLESKPKIQQLLITHPRQVPTTAFMPKDPVTTTMPYIQPQYNYKLSPLPAWSLDTKQNTHTENVKVKEGSETRNRVIKQLFLVIFGMILCGIPLAVITTLYVQLKTSDSTTITTIATTTTDSITLPTQCRSYTINNDSTRNIAYGAGALCDNTLTAGWYRFMGGAGTKLATIYVSRDTCATYYGGSYNGSMPSTAGTTMYGTLCLNNNGYLCYAPWSGSVIGVTNCNGYYVYYLSPILTCNSRYCTTT